MLLRLHTPVYGVVWTGLFRLAYHNAWRCRWGRGGRALNSDGGMGSTFPSPSISSTYFLGPWQGWTNIEACSFLYPNLYLCHSS